VVAVVVKAESVELSPQDVIDFANGRMARYKLPRQVVFTDLLPRNPAGKVLKNLLRGDASAFDAADDSAL
jgi:acyl-CoA synthetase (AMP-forming)/AMP-acid ligase II